MHSMQWLMVSMTTETSNNMETDDQKYRWCQHITWEESMAHNWGYWFDLDVWGVNYIGYAPVEDNWIVCPICAAKRPAELPVPAGDLPSQPVQESSSQHEHGDADSSCLP